MKNSSILSMIHTALMAVFIAVCAWITIPSPVPFTMQTFALYLTLMLLGGKKGICSILLYVLLGIAGIPVFSGFGSGLGYILGPTGGFIFGFILCGIIFAITEKLCTKASHSLVILSIGTVLCYITGTLWFMFSTDTGFLESVLLCTLPYIIPDALKLFTAFQVSKRLKAIKLINKE